MAMFAAGFNFASEFDDLDAMAAALPAWKLEISHLGSGRFGAQVGIASIRICRSCIS